MEDKDDAVGTSKLKRCPTSKTSSLWLTASLT